MRRFSSTIHRLLSFAGALSAKHIFTHNFMHLLCFYSKGLHLKYMFDQSRDTGVTDSGRNSIQTNISSIQSIHNNRCVSVDSIEFKKNIFMLRIYAF